MTANQYVLITVGVIIFPTIYCYIHYLFTKRK